MLGQNPFLDSAFETMGLNPRVSPKILRVTFLYQNPFLDSAFETMGLNPRVSPKILRVTFLYHQAHLSVAVLDQMHLTALGISEVPNACTVPHASSIVSARSTYSNVCSAPAYLLN